MRPKTLILRDKGEFTKFQILLEIKRNQPHIKQKDVSDKIGITIQAICKYFKKLQKEGYIEPGSERADYRLSPKATSKLQEDLHQLENFLDEVKQELRVERALPAIATQSVVAGQEVGLIMQEGVMFTVPVNSPLAQAKGLALTDAQAGEDLGLRELKGKVKVSHGSILIIKLPSIRKGGSRVTNIEQIRALYESFKPDRIGVMGAVGRAVLNKLGYKSDIEFGIGRAAAIAASRGLNVMVLVVGKMVNRVIEEVDSVNMKSGTEVTYEVRDGQLK